MRLRHNSWGHWIAYGVLIALLFWVLSAAVSAYQQSHPNRTHAMTSIVKEKQTLCFGRYLIDVPQPHTLRVSAFKANGVIVTIKPNVSREAFAAYEQKRWLELKSLVKNRYGKPFEKPSLRLTPVDDAVIHQFEHKLMNTSTTAEEKIELTYQSEGVMWRNGVMYVFEKGFDQTPSITEIMKNLVPITTPNQYPTVPGLCVGTAFLKNSDNRWSEGVELTGNVSSKRLGLTVTHGFADDDYDTNQSLLERQNRILAELADVASEVNQKTHRAAQRPVGDLSGEEFVSGRTSPDKGAKGAYQTSITAQWRHIGEHTLTQQTVNAQMTLKFTAPESTKGGFLPTSMEGVASEEEFFAVWDSLISSIRVRPGAF